MRTQCYSYAIDTLTYNLDQTSYTRNLTLQGKERGSSPPLLKRLVGLEMGRAKPALGRTGPGYWAGWVMKIIEP
jgi:hypothetical protein